MTAVLHVGSEQQRRTLQSTSVETLGLSETATTPPPPNNKNLKIYALEGRRVLCREGKKKTRNKHLHGKREGERERGMRFDVV